MKWDIYNAYSKLIQISLAYKGVLFKIKYLSQENFKKGKKKNNKN